MQSSIQQSNEARELFELLDGGRPGPREEMTFAEAVRRNVKLREQNSIKHWYLVGEPDEHAS